MFKEGFYMIVYNFFKEIVKICNFFQMSYLLRNVSYNFLFISVF